MRILVNGEGRNIDATTLEAALAELGYAGTRVATAVDGDVVPASRRVSCRLDANGAVQLVAPMQGG